MNPQRRLIDAYLRWDGGPGSEPAAQALEDVVQAVAAEVRIPPTQLRLRIVAERRSGHSVQAAVKRVLA